MKRNHMLFRSRAKW